MDKYLKFICLLTDVTGSFTTVFNQDMFSVIFVIWCLSLISERFIIEGDLGKEVRTREDRGSRLLIYISVILSIMISFSLGNDKLLLIPNFFFYIGIVFMLGGIILREFSVITLRKYFSFRIRVTKDQKIVETGPYHFIRHPSYSGGILAIIGISLALRSLIAIFIVIVLCAIAYGFRIKFEERVMKREFGDEYINYMKRSKRLIPFIF